MVRRVGYGEGPIRKTVDVTLALQIQALRAIGLTQADIAEVLGVSQACVARYCRFIEATVQMLLAPEPERARPCPKCGCRKPGRWHHHGAGVRNPGVGAVLRE